MIEVHVTYCFKDNDSRDAFYQEVRDAGIIQASRNEDGNIMYEYYYPIGKDAEIFLLEQWNDEKAIKSHGESEHYAGLQLIKKKYVSDFKIIKNNFE